MSNEIKAGDKVVDLEETWFEPQVVREIIERNGITYAKFEGIGWAQVDSIKKWINK